MADGVVAVVRHREAVLGCRTGTGGHALPSASGGADATLEGLLADLGVGSYQVEHRVEAAGAVVSLVTSEGRPAAAGERCRDPTWAPPADLFDPGEPDWPRYRAVTPTAETVAADRERGSAAIATDALWALRDAATEARSDGDRADVEAATEALLAARPAMAALANRVNRAMAGAESPAAVERAATEGLVRAAEADAAAAELAAETIDGGRVLTLSRSGTVRRALLAARPSVEVLASQPGGEGHAVAEALAAAGLAVTTSPDAAVYDRCRSGAVDAVLVGADAVTPDGGVVNKVGTRAAALAAERADLPFYVVCASDKIRPSGATEPPRDPLFDLTPAAFVTALLTERGRLTAADVATVAAEHRSLRDWRD